MLFGDRIKTPSGLFPAEFVEMRLFGSYEPAVRPALLFRLLELAIEGAHLQGNPAFRSFLSVLSQTPQEANQAIAHFTAAQGDKAALYQLVLQLASASGPLRSLNAHNPASFQSLCTTAGFSLNSTYFGVAGDTNTGVEIAMGLHNNHLFLLYPNYTIDSFVDFPCGHYHLKYAYFQLLQRQFNQHAAAYDDFAKVQLACSCGCSVLKAVYSSCFSSPFPVPSRATSQSSCYMCNRLCSAEDRCEEHWCCLACRGKNYLAGSFRYMPCCKREISEIRMWELREKMRKSCEHLEAIMADLRHDKALKGKYSVFIEGNYHQTREKTAQVSPYGVKKQKRAVSPRKARAMSPITAQKGENTGLNAPIEEEKNTLVPVKLLSNPQKAPLPLVNTHISASKTEPKAVEKPSRCQSCGNIYIERDLLYQCVQACQCHFCILQTLVGLKTPQKCSFCGGSYPIEGEMLTSRGYRRCHVCEVVVELNEMESAAPCHQICRKCVTITKSTLLGVTISVQGTCRRCNSHTKFDIDEGFYREMKAQAGVSACCMYGNERDLRLSCGHYVCLRHNGVLKVCRVCQKPVRGSR